MSQAFLYFYFFYNPSSYFSEFNCYVMFYLFKTKRKIKGPQLMTLKYPKKIIRQLRPRLLFLMN